MKRGAMKTVKTAISISEQIFLRAEETAKRLGMNRSQLFSTALAEFLARHQQDKITEKLNEVYGSEVSELNSVLAKMARRPKSSPFTAVFPFSRSDPVFLFR